jgi:UDP-glucose 4-epimerase
MQNNSTLLITGGTGSFGTAVLKRFVNNPIIKEIRILSRDEEKQYLLRRTINSKKVKFYIGDVRNYNSIKDSINGSNYIFHAAALKQVPSCEFFPLQAVETNIIGTENVLNAAIEFSVKKVIVLSTDKAVYPINAMGMSKALMEKVMIAKSRIGKNKTLICGTRYGNVMASRGSIIPVIIEQILKKKNITVTDKNMTRFMMTLDNAVDLVLYAFQNGKPGDILVQKSPAANMLDVAKTLKEIFNSKSSIKFIGVRHGEKLFETLINKEEMSKCYESRNYFRIPADNRNLDYDKYLSSGHSKISSEIEYNSNNTKQLSIKEIKKLILRLDGVKKNTKLI